MKMQQHLSMMAKKYIKTLAAWGFAIGVCLLIYAYAQRQAPGKSMPEVNLISPAHEAGVGDN